MDTDLALRTHAGDTLAAATGRTLTLVDPPNAWGALPPTVVETVRWSGTGEVEGTFDTIVSVGNLASAADLAGLLHALAAHATPETRLLFCEPTIATDEPTSRPPHDITTTLWRCGWSVIDCRRFRKGRGRRSTDYVWGRARLTPVNQADTAG